jgi:hypothetical protein
LDFEDRVSFEQFFKEILNATLVVKTPHGGVHVWLKETGEVPRRSIRISKAPALDLLGEGGYGVLPPSRIDHTKCDKTKCNREGWGQYEITSSTDEIMPTKGVFEFVMHRCRQLGWDLTETRPRVEEILPGVSEGMRNDAAFQYARYLLFKVKLDLTATLVELKRWNALNNPPLPEEELETVWRSAQRYPFTSAGAKAEADKGQSQGEFFNFSTPPRGGNISSVETEDATKPMSLKDVEEILTQTLKHDHENKLIVFLNMLLNYLGDDQQNILFNAPSATGKSYIALEIAKMFPAEDVDKKGYTSPTSFFHVMGKLCGLDGKPLEDHYAYVRSKLAEWEEKHPRPQAPDYSDKSPEAVKARRVLSEWKALRKSEYYKYKEEWDRIEKIYVVSLEKRILIFKDQPHDRILQVLRSMLSHDEKVLEVDITDKTKEGGHRTKRIRVLGFPTVIFCSASFSLDEQERTRFWILSPDMSQAKLMASLKLQARRLGDVQAFESTLDADAKRATLMHRIRVIKASNIKQVTIPQTLADNLLAWFTDGRDLSPRDQRDFPRLIALVKSHALFQMFQRDRTPDGSIIANEEDVDVAKRLLNNVMDANRLGLPPYVYKFYVESLEPSITEYGITRERFNQLYFVQFKERLGEKARKRLIDLLSEAGLIEEKPDPEDKRKMKMYIPLGEVYEKIKISPPVPAKQPFCGPCPGCNLDTLLDYEYRETPLCKGCAFREWEKDKETIKQPHEPAQECGDCEYWNPNRCSRFPELVMVSPSRPACGLFKPRGLDDSCQFYRGREGKP